MSAPYFKVDEEVIFESSKSPFNGPCIVIDILPPSRKLRINKYAEGTLAVTEEFVYWLDVSKGIASNKFSGWVRQSSLRKKHQDGEDFSTLMNSLKSPITQGVK